MPRPCVCFVLFLLFSLPSRVVGQTTPAKPPQPNVEHAFWTENAERVFGISKKDFVSMNLSKLTKDEFASLLVWVGQRRNNAEEEGKKEGISEGLKQGLQFMSDTMITYSCGPILNDASVTKVHVMVDAVTDTPPEVLSGFLERLRSLSDVQIVYDSKDADLEISLVAFELRTAGTNQNTGYVASVTITEPCISRIGKDEAPFRMYDNNLLHASGRDVKALIEDVVSVLNAKEFEFIRKHHADQKKLLEQNKKPASSL